MSNTSVWSTSLSGSSMRDSVPPADKFGVADVFTVVLEVFA